MRAFVMPISAIKNYYKITVVKLCYFRAKHAISNSLLQIGAFSTRQINELSWNSNLHISIQRYIFMTPIKLGLTETDAN